MGGAAFSDRHANFIVNLGGARAEEVRALIELARHQGEGDQRRLARSGGQACRRMVKRELGRGDVVGLLGGSGGEKEEAQKRE